MTRDAPDPAEWEISSTEEFDSALQLLLLSALENDLDIRGAWDFQNGQSYPDLEVLITELTKQT